MLSLERLVYGIGEECAVDHVAVADGELALLQVAPKPGRDVYDVVVSLDGRSTYVPKAHRWLVPLFDNSPTELGVLAAILDGRDLRIGVLEWTIAATRSVSYLAETELPAIFAKTLNVACTRALDIMLLRLEGGSLPNLGAEVAAGLSASETYGAGPIMSHTLTTFTARLQRRLHMLARGGDRWAVGWRNFDGSGLHIDGKTQSLRYTLLEADARRFYADPFPIQKHGRSYLFCEEFAYSTGRGLISVVELNGNAVPTVTPIIEEAHHLSYPMIFEERGQFWMIPEAGAGNSIVLYRCSEFPSRWVREAVLVNHVIAYDPTIYVDDGGYWLFFTSSETSTSPSDRLSLYRAPTLLGPWTPFGTQPVAIDPRSSRPAGHLLRQNTSLYRPAQNCSKRYGSEVVFCQVNALGSKPYDQVCVGRLAPTNGAFRGAHTYNRHGNIEAVDIFGAPNESTFELTYSALIGSAPGTSPRYRREAI